MSDFRLTVFVSVAKHLSFTKAAKELYISQPAVTKHIKELESIYGVRLFERMGNAIALTREGELLLVHCRRILAEYQALDYEMNLLHDRYGGELKLGASSTIAQYVIPPMLARFSERFPDIKTSLLTSNSETIETALTEHDIDLGLVEGSVRKPTLHYTDFLEDELVAIVSTHNDKVAAEISVEQLRLIPLVLREYGSGTLEVMSDALRKRDVKLSDLHVTIHLGNTESIKLYIDNSDCMGVVSIRSVAKDLLAGRFRVVDIEGVEMRRTFNFVERQGQEDGLAALFMKFAISHNSEL